MCEGLILKKTWWRKYGENFFLYDDAGPIYTSAGTHGEEPQACVIQTSEVEDGAFVAPCFWQHYYHLSS